MTGGWNLNCIISNDLNIFTLGRHHFLIKVYNRFINSSWSILEPSHLDLNITHLTCRLSVMFCVKSQESWLNHLWFPPSGWPFVTFVFCLCTTIRPLKKKMPKLWKSCQAPFSKCRTKNVIMQSMCVAQTQKGIMDILLALRSNATKYCTLWMRHAGSKGWLVGP